MPGSLNTGVVGPFGLKAGKAKAAEAGAAAGAEGQEAGATKAGPRRDPLRVVPERSPSGSRPESVASRVTWPLMTRPLQDSIPTVMVS